MESLETKTKAELRGELTRLRDEVDKTDDSIVGLIVRRFKLCEQIACVKYWLGMSIEDNGRESEVHTRTDTAAARNGGYDYVPTIRIIYNTIMGRAKDLQRKIIDAMKYGRRS